MKIANAIGVCAAASLWAAPALAQQVIRITHGSPLPAIYRSETPKCKPGLSMAARYKIAIELWQGRSVRHERENVALCVIAPALEGYAPAQTLLADTYQTRYGYLDLKAAPLIEDMDAAFYWLGKASANGDARGTFELGQFHEMGIATRQDDVKAEMMYTRALALGYGPAKAALKLIQSRDERTKAFMTPRLERADKGEAAAMREIAGAYMSGNPVKRDLATAAAWLLKAANAGDPLAQFQLATLYENGQGVEKDVNVAVDWYLKARTGMKPPQDGGLVVIYKTAKDLTPDRKARIEAIGKTTGLKGYLGVPLDDAFVPVPEIQAKPESALDMGELQTKADAGDMDAQYALGVVFTGGFGVEADRQKAIFWLEKAAAQGIPDAAVNLGDLYYDNSNDLSDKPKALYWYEQAAAKADSVGLKNAAIMYKTGDGTPLNVNKAYAIVLRMYLYEMPEAASLLRDLTPKVSFEDRARALAISVEAYLSWYPTW